MGSTFSGIEIGKKGVMAHSQALNTTGHNLSNINTEGYSRQRVVMSASDPLYSPDLVREQRAGQVGQGVRVASIERIRDEFIDSRIVQEKASLGFYKIRENYLLQIQHVFNEPAEGGMPSLRVNYDNFVKQWDVLANRPTDAGARAALIRTATTFSSSLNSHYRKIEEIRQNADRRIRTNVELINDLTGQIVKLNVEIKKSKSAGDNPNDLMDKRDMLVEKLSTLANVNIQRGGEDDVIVYIGSQHLIQGDTRQELAVINDPNNGGLAKVVWKNDNASVEFNDGEMKGLLVIRDVEAKNKLRELNSLAINVAESVNDIHRDGFGLNRSTNNNFFKHIAMTSDARGNYDRNGDGINDSTVLFKVTGLNRLELNTQVGSDGVINLGRATENGENILIRYTATDTVRSVIEKINRSDAGVSAYLNYKGQLTLKATQSRDAAYPDHVIRHVEDSGNFLVNFAGLLKAKGEAGSYNWERINASNNLQGGERYYTVAYKEHAANWFSLSTAIHQHTDNIALRAGRDSDNDGYNDTPEALGDARVGRLIVSVLDTQADRSGMDASTRLDHNPVFVEKKSVSFRQYMEFMVRELGTQARDAQIGTSKETAILKSLENTRQSVSGVNIDEELANMIKYQHGYAASARIISVMDKMLETIITRMGA